MGPWRWWTLGSRFGYWGFRRRMHAGNGRVSRHFGKASGRPYLRPQCEHLEPRCLLSVQSGTGFVGSFGADGPATAAATQAGAPLVTTFSPGAAGSVGTSRLLGGTDWDEISAVARDAEGNWIVAGTTYSAGWIAGGFDSTWGGSGDAFVAKLTAPGALVWSTYLGGDGDDGARGLAVDAQGNVFVAGVTRSAGWVSGGYDTAYGGYGDAFVAKISSQGMHVWSTYLGGTAYDGAEALTLDAGGNIFVAGTTGSSGWGYLGFDSSYNGGIFDGFLAKLSPNGARLWASYLGGNAWDTATDLVLSSNGDVVVVGKTSSSGWVHGGVQTNYLGGAFDGYALRASASGQRWWSTYLGGSGEDSAASVATDPSGRIVIAGETQSGDWPIGITTGTYAGGKDLFVTSLADDGSSVAWTTLLGGTLDEQSGRLLVRPDDGVFLAGTTYSPNWCSGGLDDTLNGTTDGCLLRLRADGTPDWKTYLGGGDLDSARTVIDGGSGAVLVVGGTASSDWPFLVPPDAFQGVRDGFLLRVTPSPPLEELGDTDLVVLPDLTMGALGERLFRLVPTRSGVLTVEALNLVGGAELSARLYDHNPLGEPSDVPLAEFAFPAAAPRLDGEVVGGQEYFLDLRGNATSFDLRLANLLVQDPSGWIGFGTSGADLLEVNGASGTVTINGVAYSLPSPSQAALFRFEAGTGWDAIILRDGAGNDTVRLYPGVGDWDSGGSAPPMDWHEVEEVHFYATSGGQDRVEFYDHRVDASGELVVKFKSEPQYHHAKVIVPGVLYHRAKLAEEVAVFASGENDQAILWGSEGEDRLQARYGLAQFSGLGFAVELRDVAFITAYAISGGTDVATLYDSPLKDEFHGKSNKSEMFDQVTGGGGTASRRVISIRSLPRRETEACPLRDRTRPRCGTPLVMSWRRWWGTSFGCIEWTPRGGVCCGIKWSFSRRSSSAIARAGRIIWMRCRPPSTRRWLSVPAGCRCKRLVPRGFSTKIHIRCDGRICRRLCGFGLRYAHPSATQPQPIPCT